MGRHKHHKHEEQAEDDPRVAQSENDDDDDHHHHHHKRHHKKRDCGCGCGGRGACRGKQGNWPYSCGFDRLYYYGPYCSIANIAGYNYPRNFIGNTVSAGGWHWQ